MPAVLSTSGKVLTTSTSMEEQRGSNVSYRDNKHEKYSGTPPYDHPVYKTTSLLRPYSFKPKVQNIDSFYYFKDPVNATTSLLRPGFYGPTVVVLTGFHCNEVYEVGLFSFFFLVPNMVLANMNTVEPR